VGPFQAKASLKQRNQLVKVSVALILLDKVLQLIGMHNKVKTANLCQTELFLGNAGFVDLLPDLDAVGLASALDSGLVVLQVHKRRGKLGPVRDRRIEDLSSLVVAFLVRLVTRLLDVGNVRSA